ncbi:hypothetical protein AB4114_11110 [Paenibacillus sp. 2RAB27]|uniref:DUF4376 domain-containing protein n=1 Tax=Paenibacillus sp. 2RAB27 TaxID=3232991 RepID=UPI003F96E172
MGNLIERDGKTYCVEEGGYEWEYEPTFLNHDPSISPSDAKIAELNAACNAAILAGFTSDALGSPHTYSFDYDSQINLGGIYSAILGGLITTPQVWRASGVPVPHTIDQLKILFAHGMIHKNTNIGRYQYLEGIALAGETPLEDIVW